MTTLTPDALRLCAALDAAPADDVPVLLGLLADALEEAGDPRAAGLRVALARDETRYGYCPDVLNGIGPWTRFGWLEAGGCAEPLPWSHLPGEVFARLAGGRHDRPSPYRHYPSRNETYLALALALVEADHA